MMSGSVRFVGRQPILDAEQRLFGYELLFRAGAENAFSGDSCSATRQMLDNVLVLGLDTVSPGGKAFLNCTREALVDRLVTILPASSTVLEVLETVEVDDEVVAACEELTSGGYEIALDDYAPGTTSDRLLHLAAYIKVDLRMFPSDRLHQVRTGLAGCRAKLLAEKVETDAEFRQAIADGFEYFQGYFFCRPVVSEHRLIPGNQVIYLQLIGAVNRQPCNLREIERLISAEASLCFRVLRLVNSAGFGLRTYITSIRQALLMVGILELRKLVMLAGAARLGDSARTPPELMLRAFQHARFCELLASGAGQFGSEQFLIGLLSQFDAILQVPMGQIVKLIPLSVEAANALCGEANEAGLALRVLQRYEARDWAACEVLCKDLKLSETELESIYVDSLQWATSEVRKAGL
jgi:EAL and modified HD-GYP domain-containing signal transduction protein